jgi:hypothetical protein
VYERQINEIKKKKRQGNKKDTQQKTTIDSVSRFFSKQKGGSRERRNARLPAKPTTNHTASHTN